MDRTARILGIDPGLNITGYGVIEPIGARAALCEAGVIRTTPGADLAARVREIFEGVGEVVEQYRPRVMVVEQLYAHYKHPRTAILMGHARGTIFLAAALRDVEVVSYAATRIKKTITGHGRASKDQIQRTIQQELGLLQVPEPPDIADALAGALCHFFFTRRDALP
jgi:crossover junction endodeoxyribonuclease RuvC